VRNLVTTRSVSPAIRSTSHRSEVPPQHTTGSTVPCSYLPAWSHTTQPNPTQPTSVSARTVAHGRRQVNLFVINAHAQQRHFCCRSLLDCNEWRHANGRQNTSVCYFCTMRCQNVINIILKYLILGVPTSATPFKIVRNKNRSKMGLLPREKDLQYFFQTESTKNLNVSGRNACFYEFGRQSRQNNCGFAQFPRDSTAFLHLNLTTAGGLKIRCTDGECNKASDV